jgi:hypothetical protein
MAKVKTFTSDLRIFKTAGQLDSLDEQVNEFIKSNNIETIHSVSDTTAADDTGATIGIIRVLAYD